MSDVHPDSPSVQWDDVQHVHDIVISDWESGHLTRANEFVVGNHGYCTLCKQVLHDEEIHDHAEGIAHMLLYKEYLSKYSTLMHVKATMCPMLQNAQARLCAAYDAIVMTSASQRSQRVWESAFRYAAGQRSFKSFRQSFEEPEEQSSTQTENRTPAPQCVCCWSSSRDVMFRPCKHVVACSTCAERLTACPICREAIAEKEIVYCS